jgi:hypothetical protein
MAQRNPKRVGRLERALRWLERTSPRFQKAYDASPAPIKSLWWTVSSGIGLLFSTAVLALVGTVSFLAKYVAVGLPFHEILQLFK